MSHDVADLRARTDIMERLDGAMQNRLTDSTATIGSLKAVLGEKDEALGRLQQDYVGIQAKLYEAQQQMQMMKDSMEARLRWFQEYRIAQSTNDFSGTAQITFDVAG
ncbi:hypothetical protein PUNSTDRAFT_128943 [Punctularia strigosozonata HHB-11173 SS5]|uniref:uncharacterized protein n=1 Tax=Punctularia strigosozonata (strain HHB-11173) TaxID=741275 RepID=UPI000441712A|nr:uncharacterized protein PUNSTDRAFT_128943 [Punctularia strigosozonata HHB-11173 SS5]EIN13256.1 hypothetical protein PUNSTDRAFT_128943 [Punctularia strigosozonata HHB-11173 SS5]